MNDGDYCFVIHPKILELFDLTPKERWKIKYRGERLARKGKFEPLPRGVLGSVPGFVYVMDKL